MKEWVLATTNQGKWQEMSAALNNTGIQLRSAQDWTMPPVAETGETFVENALLKARAAAKHTGLPALADDSGLVVDALQGRPGIHSARFAGEHASDQDNINHLLSCLVNIPLESRQAYFVCVLVLLQHGGDPLPQIFYGKWQGRITSRSSGQQGFGYDPVFWLDSHQCTAAQLAIAEKNRISHRGQAMAKLRKFLA